MKWAITKPISDMFKDPSP